MEILNGNKHLVSNPEADFHLFVMHDFTDSAYCETSSHRLVLIIITGLSKTSIKPVYKKQPTHKKTNERWTIIKITEALFKQAEKSMVFA